MLRWHLYSHPGSPDLIPTSGIISFCVWSLFKSSLFIHADLLPHFVWPPSYQGRPLLSPEEIFLENRPALLPPYSLCGHIPCHSLKLSKPSLLIPCLLFVFLLWIFWTPPSCVAAAKTLTILTSSLESVKFIRASPFISSLDICIGKFSSQHCRSLDCLIPATFALLFQQLSGWLKSPVMSRAWKHTAFSNYLKKTLSVSSWWGRL